MRVLSRSLCSALLSKLIGLAKSNTVMTSPVFTLLQCYSEGRRVEDTDVYLEFELNYYFKVWRSFSSYFCFKYWYLKQGPQPCVTGKKLLSRGNENGIA